MKIPSNSTLPPIQSQNSPSKQMGVRALISLVAILGVIATLMLGQWQLSRGEQKEQMLALLEKQMSLDPLGQEEFKKLATSDLKSYVNRRINLSGQWIQGQTVYLANRSHAGKSGFWVMTPLKLGEGVTVMVERGWVAWNPKSPSEMPTDVQTPSASVTIEGLIVEPPSKMLELWGGSGAGTKTSEEQPSQQQTYLRSGIWQNFDLNLFESQTGLKLSAVVHQLGSPSEGLIRELPAQGVSADRNFGYAVQWFMLSALIAGLYLWFQWIKPRIHAR